MKKIIKKIKNNFIRKKKRIFYNLSNSFLVFKSKLFYFFLMHWTYPKKIFIGILLILLIGACLIYNPLAYKHDSYEYVNNSFIFYFKENGVNKKFSLNFLSSLFTASSAFTNTGFSLFSISSKMTFFGQFIIYCLIQIGGFGYLSIIYLIGKLIRNFTKKNVFSSILVNIERGGTKISKSSVMIKKLFLISFFTQLIFSFIFTLIFYFYPFYEQQSWNELIDRFNNGHIEFSLQNKNFLIDLKDKEISNLINLSFDNIDKKPFNSYKNFGNSLWNGIFLTGSAINNAGFDLFGSSSIQIIRNDFGIFSQILILFLFIFGGIGFPLIYDLSYVFEWFFKKKILFNLFKVQKYEFLKKPTLSLFSKVSLISTIIVSLFSIVFVFSSEYLHQLNIKSVSLQKKENLFNIINHPNLIKIVTNKNEIFTVNFFGKNTTLNKNFALFFNSLSTRSAGFQTINILNLRETTIFIFSILMVIGTAPSSTGGGIRITTLTVIFKSIISKLKGIKSTSIFKRKIPSETIKNAYIVFLITIFLLITTSLIINLTSGITTNSLDLDNNHDDSIYHKLARYSFVHYFFNVSSAIGTSGLSVGIVDLVSYQWWNLFILIVLMFIGQMGTSNMLLIFARKVPKKNEKFYLEQNIVIG